jgi:predicted bacteriocin transport accessory protein
MKNNKLLIFIVIMCITIATFIFVTNLNNDNVNSKYLNKTNYNEFKQLIKDKETFILYIGSKDCSHCKAFKPKLIDVLEQYKINVKYVDLSTYSEKDRDNLFSIINISGTPTVSFVINGEESSTMNRISGDVTKDQIIEKMKINNYIK